MTRRLTTENNAIAMTLCTAVPWVSYAGMTHILLFTLAVAGISTICIAPVALALAAWSWRAGTKGLVLDALGALPLVLPPTAIGFVLLEILSRRSAIGAFLDRIGIEVIFTP